MKTLADHRSLPDHRQPPKPQPYACNTYDAAIHLGLIPEDTDMASKEAQSAQRTVRKMLNDGTLHGYYTGNRWMVAHASINDMLSAPRGNTREGVLRRFYSPNEVAVIFNVPLHVVKQWIDEGQIEGVHVANRYFVPADYLDGILSSAPAGQAAS